MELIGHLESLAAVVDSGSFTRAAGRLGLPQPVISRRIANLERVWGQPLLERSTRTARSARPTPFALAVLPHVREVLAQIERLDRAVAAAGSEQTLLIGIPEGRASSALAALLDAAGRHGVALGIRELTPAGREAAFANAELGYTLRRVGPEEATWRVSLGLATSPARPRPAGRWHLDALRPRRDAAVREESLFADGDPMTGRADPMTGRGDALASGAPDLLIEAEDDLETWLDRLRRAVARAGLSPARIEIEGPGAAAARVLAADAVFITDRVTARRLDLAWAPLADRGLDRGYELGAQPGRRARHTDWMAPLLGAVLGARPGPAAPAGPGSGSDAEPAAGAAGDALDRRLAASG